MHDMIQTIDMMQHPERLEALLKRASLDQPEAEQVVRTIIETVKRDGDAALLKYTKQFDGIDLTEMKVPEAAFDEAIERLDPLVLQALETARDNIRAYHEKQIVKPFTMSPQPGVLLGQLIRPIDAVGIYVPGGTAPLPSTLLMAAVPAGLAGVGQIVVVTPPNRHGQIDDAVLAAARLTGVHAVYKVGGAQAIAALAYGTESVPKVDKIVGPGNLYVTLAKKHVFGIVGIDMIAGPSEIVVLADDTANPDYVAADLLSQAEHDTRAGAWLVTPSKSLAKAVEESLKKQLATLSRQTIAAEALNTFGALIVTETLDEAIALTNRIAPEHLEIMTEDPIRLYPKITHAGAIFLGPYAPEPLGDYFAGPNHTLPTSGTARFASPLSTADFCKRMSLIKYDQAALDAASDAIIRLAEIEGLDAHAAAIRIRRKGRD
ncbi:MAG: histidinol dehydrogenase [Acholeplasmatales bacterium]|nr:MAG: histidinol dehydrogenase [Acholeplasmatales bacterium]